LSLKIVPKEEYRFRKFENKYAGITVHVYLNNADAIRPIADSLRGKDLHIDSGLGDKKIFPLDLIRMANEVGQANLLGR